MSASCVRSAVRFGQFFALVVLLAGCEARVAVDVTLNRDGGGELALALATDPELDARARAAGADPVEAVAETGRALAPRGWRTTVDRDEAGARVLLRRAFGSPAELEALTRELAEGLEAPEVAPLQPFLVTVEDERLHFSGGASLVLTRAVEEHGLLAADAVGALDGAVDYRVTATFPGEVLEASGQAEGRTVTWVVRPGHEQALTAVAVRPGPALGPYLAAGALLGLLALIVVLRMRRSRRRLAAARLGG